MTWQIMIGAQLISVLLSAGTVIAFMLKKEPLETAYAEPVPTQKQPAAAKVAATTI